MLSKTMQLDTGPLQHQGLAASWDAPGIKPDTPNQVPAPSKILASERERRSERNGAFDTPIRFHGSLETAWRFRFASMRAEFRPVRTMNGHKNVQTMTHKIRPPNMRPVFEG